MSTILDDLTNQPITKQERYRIRHARRGLCKNCARVATTPGGCCGYCAMVSYSSFKPRVAKP